MSDYLRPEYTPLFTQVQDFIADQLNTDPQLSALGIEFLPEHRLDIEYEIKNNLGKQGTVGIVNTLKGTYGGHNGSTNAWEIEAEVDVLENPPVRRAQMKKMGLSAGSTADILDWVQESMCGPSSPTYGKFCAMSQELGEDRGIIVGRSIMKTFAIADVSAVVSGEHQWICPYALWSDLSALSGQVQDIVVEIDNKRDKMDLSVYDYGAWSLYEYRIDSETGEPIVFDPPIQMEYRQVATESWDMPMWITTSQTQPDTYFAISPDAQTAYELVYAATPDYDYTIIYSYTTTLSEDGTRITGLEVDGNVVNCDARRSVVAETGDRLAKMSDLSSISSIPPYIEDVDGNKIEADLDCYQANPLSPWFYSSNQYTYDPTTQKWIWTEPGLGLDKQELTFLSEYNGWTLKFFSRQGDWDEWQQVGSDSAIGGANATELNFETADMTFTRTVLEQDKLALESDLPTKTSDLTNDSGFITSAEIEPYHDVLTPNVNTGVAKQALTIALREDSIKLKPNSALAATVNTNIDLTDEFTALMAYTTYHPYNLEKYFEQTFSPALELKFCEGKIAYMVGSRPRTIYTGYMFRTGGAGFAMPCSEDGTPDGRLYETTDVTRTAVIIANQTTSLHQLTFATRYNDPYGNVVAIDGQSEQMTCWRTNALKMFVVSEELANKSDLPTKTSDLTNDSGFITSAEVPTPDRIEDLSANVINADRTVSYIEEVDNWTEYSYPHDPLNWDAANNWWRADISPSFYMKLQFNSGTWTLETGENIGGEWVVVSDSVQDSEQATFLMFNVEGAGYTLTRGTQQIQTTGELALKSYVDGIVGDINTILDNINGEVI